MMDKNLQAECQIKMAEINSALAQNLQDWQIWYQRGREQEKVKSFEDAIASFERA